MSGNALELVWQLCGLAMVAMTYLLFFLAYENQRLDLAGKNLFLNQYPD